MEDLQNHRPLRWLPFFLLLIYCHTGLSVSTDYTLPSEYFINCGSSDNVTVGQTTFVGDSGGKAVAGLSFTKKDSSTTTELLSSPTATLNHTARIFRASDSFYRFKITNKAAGTLYFLRLHFSAFSGKLNLSEAVFDVSVPGRKLLSNFTVKEGNSTVEEFLLPIDKSGEFRLLFQPIGTLSFAFVNAVEVFALPDGFISAESPRLTPQGPNGNYDSITSQVLHTRYRVNVGGLTIEPGDDTLLRSWVTDVEYIENLNASNTIPSVTVTYQPNTTNVTEYTAPRPVYSSARNMSVNSSGANITWSFNATVNATYLVRFHFCDIVSIARDSLSMSLYIFNGSRQVIYPYKNFSLRDDTRVPFKFDFVVESGPYPYIEISIGNDSSHHTVDAYLNGLEIMEMIGTWDSVSKSSSNEDRDKALIIGLSVGGALLFLFGMLALLGLKCRRPRNDAPEPSNWTRPDFYGLGSTQGGESGSDQTIGSPFLNFNLVVPLPEILSATKNFNEKLLIGEGGFGYVYSGTLRNQKVAVKRSYPGSSQGVSEFQTEIIVLSKIKHKHLVSLIGYCCERSEMILVYEFMEKGTLREHLYSSLPNPPLPWKQRLEICIGAARGLDYLHKGTSEGIIHRDVKSTNILLDHHFTAKVADFGLSKLEEMGHEQSQVSRGFKGTLGYLDPEYLSTQVLTEKSDVYAFGVVLLEVLCARPAIDPNLPREQMNLAEWVTANIDTGSVEKIIDPSIAGEINTNSLRKFADTALKCLQDDAQERPPMKDVIWDLEYALELQKSSAQMGLLDDNSTMTNGFSMSDFSASAIHKFPSIDMSIVEVGTSIPAADTDSEVFSQLQDGNGR